MNRMTDINVHLRSSQSATLPACGAQDFDVLNLSGVSGDVTCLPCIEIIMKHEANIQRETVRRNGGR